MARHNYKDLLGALAERWWDTTNTFHFPWGEITMTPTDFSVISGIPFGIRAIELYNGWRTEVSPDRIVDLIGIDLPRFVGPSSTTPVLSVSRQGELTATQVARFTLLLLFASTFWSNRKDKFNPFMLKSLENLAHLEEYDWAGAILSRMYDDMCDLSQGHCKLSGTYYFWEYFPYTHPVLIHADLGLGLVPLAWRWYRTNLQTIRHRKSLRDLRTFFDTCTVEQEVSLENVDRLDLPPEDINEVPNGLVSQMMELLLGMHMHNWTKSLSKGEKINLERYGLSPNAYCLFFLLVHSFVIERIYTQVWLKDHLQVVAAPTFLPYNPSQYRVRRILITHPFTDDWTSWLIELGPNEVLWYIPWYDITRFIQVSFCRTRVYLLGLTHCTWYYASRVLRQMGIDQTVPIVDGASVDSVITPGVTRAILKAWVRDHHMGWAQVGTDDVDGTDEEIVMAPRIGEVGEGLAPKDDIEDVAPRRRRDT
ncbi:hypothetical protein JCGZ_09111 [Jatropha curcas]|uniref:Aminotransferase-like plant mobile domain-containing protein n=1 Tax=Jatropha curcas TaxID=180498 RepID=A0A067KL09_JATCU|nr:hypothetical protein JCGZ_09111 [Jatropha curcas]